ncbi:glycosyltransferase family 4 protein [Salmonirosea aquatica]|uniref:Glycosyltransferase n=1 Tax=Salmonirosea aquatica TaxID=2654236 RepID=A0A7C9FZ56_9BACT|nr:glycosyltransferase [Cytophagaceae bacterium SJW1-29]
MRICFIMVGLPHYFTLVLNKMVSETGHEVVLIKPQQKSKTIGSGVKEDTRGAQFGLVELPEYTAWYGKPFLENLIPTLQEMKPDIVVMSAWPYFLHFVLNPFFYFQFKKLKTRLICRDIPFNVPYWGKSREYYFSGKNQTEGGPTARTWRGYLPFGIATFLKRLYLPLADAHINYFDEARLITGSYGVPQEKIFIAANSPDTDTLLASYREALTLPPLLPHNLHRLIHVGRLVKWKRVDMLIQAVKDLQSEFLGLELVVIGFGPEEENLKELATSLGVSTQVNFVGGVYDPLTLGRYLLASTAYVLGGMGGLSINDAMCFAKPVVCTEADGTERRLVREGYNGYYFENGDQGTLNEALRKLLADPEKVARFGANSLKIIEEEINIHSVIREYQAAFDYVMRQ